jgi:hypothetical protein
MKNFEFDESISEMRSPELVIEPPPEIRWQDEPDPELRKKKCKASVDRMLSWNEEQHRKSKEGAETT